MREEILITMPLCPDCKSGTETVSRLNNSLISINNRDFSDGLDETRVCDECGESF